MWVEFEHPVRRAIAGTKWVPIAIDMDTVITYGEGEYGENNVYFTKVYLDGVEAPINIRVPYNDFHKFFREYLDGIHDNKDFLVYADYQSEGRGECGDEGIGI